MKIYTRVGDKGKTKFQGKMLEKSDPILQVIGAIDEAQAAMAIAFELIPDSHIRFDKIMYTLYEIMGSLYTGKDLTEKLTMDIKSLEYGIDGLLSKVPEITKFLLPNGSQLVAQLHFARTVVRRAEREIVFFAETINIKPIILKYINRLSDFMYAIATYYQFN
jgi:cob(I)alamin adenosyltransferase